MDIKKIEQLVKLMNGSRLTELNVESEGMKVTLKNESCGFSVAPQVALDNSLPLKEQQDDCDCKYVLSPLVGVFRNLESPIKSGDVINIGDGVCTIEAMKLINEIQAEVAGEVLEVLVSDGEMVEYEQKLFKIKGE